MFRVLPTIAALFTIVFLLLLLTGQKEDIPFELTKIESSASSIGIPGTAKSITEFRPVSLCSEQDWLFDENTPTSVYQVHLPAEVVARYKSLVVYQRAAINNRFAVLYGEPNQCWQTSVSGRALPFPERFNHSMFPNSLIDNLTKETNIYVILQDEKARNLWLGLASEQGFQKQSNHKWLICGFYIGALLVYTAIALSVAIWQKNKLALAYVGYTLVTIIWFLQNFGIYEAFMPFAVKESYFNQIHSLLTGLIILSITVVCSLFMKWSRRMRWGLIIASSTVTALLFTSPFYHDGYRNAAVSTTLLACFILIYLIKNFTTNSTFEKIFTLGLICTMTSGAIQNISVFTGYDFGGFAIFAFPIGNFLESTFWLLAISNRLLNEFNRIQIRMLFEATHDPLTRLPNRTFLENRLKTITSQSNGLGKSLFFIDIDHFKRINESMGHATGDALLSVVATRLRELTPNADTIARFGGDEFCLLIDEIYDTGAAEKLGQELSQIIARPITLLGREMCVTASIGVCLNLENYSDAETIIRNADMSVYAAKNNGRAQQVIFTNQMHEQALERFQIEQDMQPSLRKHEFSVHFQPIVRLNDCCVSGFEALLRWQHHKLGWLPPARFIPIAEDAGLINNLSEEVIQQVAKTIASWKQAELWQPDLYVSINIAGQQLLDRRLITILENAIIENNINASDIRIEITESSLVTDFDKVVATLTELQSAGYKILVDDFGSGYSSLHYLHQLPFDVLKIDQSFVSDLDTDNRKQALMKTIIDMAASLNLDVIAEGVEDEQHHQLLTQYGCSNAQGFYYGQALPTAEIKKQWLHSESISPPQGTES